MNTFEVKAYNISSFKDFREEANIGELPNILEVLDDIAEEELQRKLDPLQSSFLAELQCENNFAKIRSSDNSGFHLMPTSFLAMRFYRGQSEYYDECFSSFYRKGVKPEDKLHEQLKYCELTLLLNNHPIVQDFLHANIKVDTVAIAQHYGLKTDVLDVTSNKWTAAFFACTKVSNGSYTLLDSSYKDKIGVIYMLDANPENFIEDISVIGAQPFERPTRQNAFGVTLGEGQNFNNREGLKVIPFRHDKKAESILFDMFYKSKRLFPDDMLVGVVDAINKSNEVSMPAVLFCKDKFYADITDTELSEQIGKLGVTIVPESKITFSEDELRKQCDYWWKYGRDKLSSRIKELRVCTIPIEETRDSTDE